MSKLKSAHLNLEEVTNERDEFKDYLEALLKVFVLKIGKFKNIKGNG